MIKYCISITVHESISNTKNLLSIYRAKAHKIAEDNQELFSGYGKLEGEITLEVDQYVTPSIQPPRRIPIAMRDKLKTELVTLAGNNSKRNSPYRLGE